MLDAVSLAVPGRLHTSFFKFPETSVLAGPAAQKHFDEAGIETTHQLMGKFFSLRGKGISVRVRYR